MITPEKLKQLYIAMLLLRGARRHSGKGKDAHARFSEACIVGCGIDLHEGDVIAAAGQLVLSSMPEESQPHGVTQRASAPAMLRYAEKAEVLLLGTGVAFSKKIEKQKNVVVAFNHNPASSAFRNCVAFALAERLPVIYVEKIGSSHKPRHGSVRELPLIPVDQNDVVAVNRVASEAIDKARRGVGPTIIQCLSTPRTNGTDCFRDPIAYMEWYLGKRGLWSEEFKQSAEKSVGAATARQRDAEGIRRSDGAIRRAPVRHPRSESRP